MKTTTFILPAYWASRLINGDFSGLAESDIAACDRFIASLPEGKRHCMGCSDESYFSHRNDSSNGLAGDVLEYTFPA